MPIQGLTDKGSAPGRPKPFYHLWKGEKKGERSAGKSLGLKFRFECGDPEVMKRYLQFYKPQDTEYRIYLPYGQTDRVFETWMWGFTSGGFSHKCDGEKVLERSVKKKKLVSGKEVTYRQRVFWDDPTKKDPKEWQCKRPPGDRECPVCNPAGLFHFYIRELYGYGFGSMSVTGDRDITGLTQQLRQFEEEYGGLNNSPIPGFLHYGHIPYILKKVKKAGTTPYSKAGQVTFFDDLLITPDPEWLESVKRYVAVKKMQEDPILLKAIAPKLAANLMLTASDEEPIGNSSVPFLNEIGSHRQRLGWSLERLDEEANALYRVQTHRHIRYEDLREFVKHLAQIQAPKKVDRAALLEESGLLLKAIVDREERPAEKIYAEWKEEMRLSYNKTERQMLRDEELEDFVARLGSRLDELCKQSDDAIDADFQEVEELNPELMSEPQEDF